jgi:hypothetical protein
MLPLSCVMLVLVRLFIQLLCFIFSSSLKLKSKTISLLIKSKTNRLKLFHALINMSTIQSLVATAISSALELKPDPLEPANNTGGALCATISFRSASLRKYVLLV